MKCMVGKDSNGFDVMAAHSGEEVGVDADEIIVFECSNGTIFGWWEDEAAADAAFQEYVEDKKLYKPGWFEKHRIPGDTARPQDWRTHWSE